MTKEKFKTKATETFAKVVQGAKKGVVKARCELLVMILIPSYTQLYAAIPSYT